MRQPILEISCEYICHLLKLLAIVSFGEIFMPECGRGEVIEPGVDSRVNIGTRPLHNLQ